METTSKTLGAIGEELAYQFLCSLGYKVLLRNYESPLGEIDMIAKEKGALVFVEVKTRASESMGTPFEAVTFHKRRQIQKNAEYYIKRYGIVDAPCRFDVVSVLMRGMHDPAIEVIKNAFMAGE